MPSDLESIGSHMPVRVMLLIRCLSLVVTNLESDTLETSNRLDDKVSVRVIVFFQ